MSNKPLKILVVDDDPVVATALGRILRKHEPTVETDPEMAYRRLSGGEWFDVVVCDTKMPGLDGRQLLAVARELVDPPILVLMSGDDNVQDADADVTLHKPFTASHLLELLAVLSRQRSEATTQRIPRMPLPSGTVR
jgi:DNA-binding response OmpR family regulator